MTFENGRVREKPLVYLAGAISAAKDDGIAWRTDITPHLDHLGYRVFNPVLEQIKISGVSKEILASQKSSNFDLYKSSCEKVVDTDLNILRRSALIVCKLDDAVFSGAGTFGEITIAKFLDIPVFAWVNLSGGIGSVPSWIVGCLTSFSIYESDFYKLLPTAEAFAEKHLKPLENFYSDKDKLNNH